MEEVVITLATRQITKKLLKDIKSGKSIFPDLDVLEQKYGLAVEEAAWV